MSKLTVCLRMKLNLRFNINSLQVLDDSDETIKEIERLRLQINAMTTRSQTRPDGLRKSRSQTKFKRSESTPNYNRPEVDRLKRSWSQLPPNKQNPSHMKSLAKTDSTLQYNPKLNNSQRKPNGERDFRSSSRSRSVTPFRGKNKNKYESMDYQTSQDNSYNKNNNYNKKKYYNPRSPSRERSQTPQRYNSYQNLKKNYKSNYNPNKNYNNKYNKNKTYERTFQRGHNTVTLTFYKCKICTKQHPHGTPCTSQK